MTSSYAHHKACESAVLPRSASVLFKALSNLPIAHLYKARFGRHLSGMEASPTLLPNELTRYAYRARQAAIRLPLVAAHLGLRPFAKSGPFQIRGFGLPNAWESLPKLPHNSQKAPIKLEELAQLNPLPG